MRLVGRPWLWLTVGAAATAAAAAAVLVTPAGDGREAAPTPAPGEASMTGDVVLGVHGGAGALRGEETTDEQAQAVGDALTLALEAGRSALRDGSSVDAVEAAVVVLEDAPELNAGRGSVLTSDGRYELEASIMRGADRDAGAAAGLEHIKNPVALARLVMDRSPHVMLAGGGAERFATDHDVERVPQDYFFTQRRWDALVGARRANERANERADTGTVGAVALDGQGTLAAATSTGGRTNKAPGRIGDSPIVGAATWADDTVAVSTTGTGEHFLRLAAARNVAALMAYRDEPVARAAQAALDEVGAMGGSGGLIALDANGRLAAPFISEGMYRGWLTRDGQVVVDLFGEASPP